MAARRPTPTESARITDACARMRREGYAVRQIAVALGISPSGVSERLSKAGIERMPQVQTAPPDPDPIDWTDEANGPLTLVTSTMLGGPTYRHSTTVALLRATLTTLRHDNAVNRLANDVRDAISSSDFDWLKDAATLLADVRAYLDRLEGVLVDDERRHRAIVDPAERDDLAALRGVR